MGENAQVQLDELRRLSDRVDAAAADIADLPRPELGSALPGADVTAAVEAQPLDGRMAELAAGLQGWATAARQAADALERADHAHADRLPAR